ncbi:transcriptional regulator, GntR family [Oceanospirillum multiglobuliferum]|uniref:aminotransferase-like domain-containing protein n=1 Tax=Oceanospirillum multiglobuliferum TaxID=64969 RepID=UPI0009D5565D|nr:PLP-dependent aminotransferase family protein [Oceanospirillum multiglobuliferum]SJZ86389.1 transcriptional regulator, GntR family [Oceanospirillum multiglobuliferum]
MRYKVIAEQIIEDIREGKLSLGARMPSLRNLSRLFSVSMTTALNCYHLLEELGWIIAKPQSGFYVALPLSEQRTPCLPQFLSRPTHVAIQESDLHHPKYSGPLGISQLNPSDMPTNALHNSMKRGLKRLGHEIHRYPDRQGDLALRRSLEQHFAHYGFPFSANELVIANGCIDAVRIALEAISSTGDAIAISSPCFSGLLELLGGLGRRVVEIPSTSEGIDLEQLEQHLAQGTVVAGLFSTSHMNPQGISMSPSQKQALAALANRYQIPIIEDDIYMELGHGKVMPLPAKYWDKGGYVLWCGSVSKTLTAGFRLGWCLAGRHLPVYLKQHGISHFGVSAPVQAGLADFINSGQYHSHLQKTRLRLQQNIREYRAFLSERLPIETAISSPTGGLVLWLQVPNLNSQALWRAACEQSLDIRIGPAFSTLPLYQDCFRVNAGWSLTTGVDEVNIAKQQLELLVKLMPNCMNIRH